MPYFARVGSIPIDCKQTIALPCSASCLFFSLKIIIKKKPQIILIEFSSYQDVVE
jgi:hypothetical protein